MKYEKLFKYVVNGNKSVDLTFDECEKILGFKLDHSLINYKKELLKDGFEIKKIHLKDQFIEFVKKDY